MLHQRRVPLRDMSRKTHVAAAAAVFLVRRSLVLALAVAAGVTAAVRLL